MRDMVLVLDEVDGSRREVAGGKGVQLGELTRIPEVRVPAGFVVTTDAYRADGVISAQVADAIDEALARFGPDASFAVRSSATAEDAGDASFAGQYVSVLGVVGRDAVHAAIRRVWASLDAPHVAAYASQDRNARMAVVVQLMVIPRASGVLFTADPVSGNRRVATVEAVAGLGDALVAGTVDPDRYRERDGRVTGIGVLHHAQVTELVALGRRVEAATGAPQDIEWCLDDVGFALVQTRPITTLYPLPAGADDGAPHVYVSVGHQQMMTDAMRPLGWSTWQLIARPPMHEAGGRLFVDTAAMLASPAARGVYRSLAKHDPLLGDALDSVLASGLVPELPADDGGPAGAPVTAVDPLPADPAIVQELVAGIDAADAAAADRLRDVTGPGVFAAVREDILVLKESLFVPGSHQAIMTGMDATLWLDEHLRDWLGDEGAGDVLNQSVTGNVSSEMGLSLLDVADVVRRHPAAIPVLETAGDDVLAALDDVPGGRVVRGALQAYLDRFGMRCSGEIDITRTRFAERPSKLIPTLLHDVRHFEDGAGNRVFEDGRLTALAYRDDVLRRLRDQPDGAARAARTAEMIDRVRTFAGYREYPKYGIIRRLGVYKEALLREARRLVADGVLRAPDDAFLLTFDEFESVARSGTPVDPGLLQERARRHRADRRLRPPRILTSEGEALHGRYHRDGLPDGALVGLAVSQGTVEGRARVVLDPAGADLTPGDVLVTAHTDPSWSPVFVGIAGLVTEVGGTMTHGAVVAREYGLPAVVGVQDATRRIPDGARVRVHGTDGYVELLG